MELQKGNERKPLRDEKIIDLYWERDEKAIDETDFKYKNYLFSVAFNIVHDGLDCEECLNDTYLGAWNAIPPSRPDVLRAFLTVIMRRAAIKRYHKARKGGTVPSEMTVSLSELEEFLKSEDDVSTELDFVRLGKVISSFVRSLPSRRQYIFISRYYIANTVNAIASDLNLSRSSVNKELAAIRRDLKEKLESEGYLI